MLILTKCSQIQKKNLNFIFSTLIFLFFISGSRLAQSEIVDPNGETVAEDFENNGELACSCIDRCGDKICQFQGCDRCNFSCCESEESCPQDCVYAKQEGREFLEKMKEKLRKNPQSPQLDKSTDSSQLSVQKGEGFLTKCSYQVGEKTCGKCYCLKANPGSNIVFNGRKLRGCARLDISLVGDLTAFIGQVVYYEGTSDFNSNFICPRNFKLFTLKPIEAKTEDF